MYSCSAFVHDRVEKGNLPEMLHCFMKVHISSVLLRKAWTFVVSESSITYMVLYSIYLFSFLSLLKLWNDCTQHGALSGLKNEGTRQKGNCLPHHFIKCLFYSTFYCSALSICCCNEEINIKNLHSHLWMCRFFSNTLNPVVEPSTAQECRPNVPKNNSVIFWMDHKTFPPLSCPTRQVQCSTRSRKPLTQSRHLSSNYLKFHPSSYVEISKYY